MAPKKRIPRDVNTVPLTLSERTEKNKTAKDKRTKSKQKNPKPKSTSVYEGIAIAAKSISIIIGLLMLAIYIKNRHADIHTGTGSEFRVTESTILHQYSKIVLEFAETKQAMIGALKEEPVAKFIKLKLRPIQERVASLRTQTSQYEKLERIPGGPRNFMTTTLAELASLGKQIVPMDLEVFRIISEGKHRKLSLVSSGIEAVNSQSHLYEMFNSKDQHMFQFLATQGIDLIPLNETIKPDAPKDDSLLTDLNKHSVLLDAGVTPLELAEILERVSRLFAQREMFRNKIEGMATLVGANGVHELIKDVNMFEKILQIPGYSEASKGFYDVTTAIKETIKAEGKRINLTVPWIMEANYIIGSLMKGLNDEYEDNEVYIKLRNIVTTDINNLKARVENFQYSYLKLPADPMVHVNVV